jgi:hypothetical protein
MGLGGLTVIAGRPGVVVTHGEPSPPHRLSSGGGPNVSHAPSAMIITVSVTSCSRGLDIAEAVYTQFAARSPAAV